MRSTVALLVLVVLAGCGAFPALLPAPGPLPELGVSNGTALDVTLVVNGRAVGVFPAGGPWPSIDPVALGPLPWTVEARSPSGRVLTSMSVQARAAWSTVGPDGVVERVGVMGRVDLSCGRLTIWAGDVIPSGPVPPSNPGTPGDCGP